jgi:hypothetical protein
MEIRNKREFYRLWEAGELGNRTLLWHDVRDIPQHIRKVGFRQIGIKSGGAGAWTLVERKDAEATAAEWKSAGRNFIMDGSVPNEYSILQGEVCRTELGLQSFLAIGYGLPPMRRSMAAGLHSHRGYLATKLLLDSYLDPSSRDDLDLLLERYPDAAIEFTVFDVRVGVFPHRNTIFWETRNY